jgi:hypothetical protein
MKGSVDVVDGAVVAGADVVVVAGADVDVVAGADVVVVVVVPLDPDDGVGTLIGPPESVGRAGTA